MIPDEFDLFRSDYAYTTVPNSSSSSAGAYDVFTGRNFFNNETIKPWSMRPLVFSAGPDGEYGVTTDPITSAGVPMANYNYQATNWWWPTSVAFYGEELPGRGGTATRPFPDPYMRVFVSSNLNNGQFAGRLPGQLRPTTTSADEVTDNINNYQLQVSLKMISVTLSKRLSSTRPRALHAGRGAHRAVNHSSAGSRRLTDGEEPVGQPADRKDSQKHFILHR